MGFATRIHPEDYDIARRIASASEFTACLHLGPGQRFTTRGLPSYTAAKAEGERLTALHSKWGRRANVYAIVGGMTLHVDDKLAALAGVV